MNNLFYRVTYNDIGIYDALKKELYLNNKMGIWNNLINSKYFNWLKKPNTYNENCISFFTKEGFNNFKKYTLSIITKYLDSNKIVIKEYNFDILNNKIIYKDENQIVTLK